MSKIQRQFFTLSRHLRVERKK